MVPNVPTAAAVPSRSRAQATIDRAVGKAYEQAGAGNLPRLLSSVFTGSEIVETWAIGSRTTAGALYTVNVFEDVIGITSLCDCAAGDAQRVCWHRAMARLGHTDNVPFHRAPGVVRCRRRADQPAPVVVAPRHLRIVGPASIEDLSGPRWS